jgi:divalent metal cation (Fe/Co/Zn/Cd) transporter
VGAGIIGNLAVYPLLDPVAAAAMIVGFMVIRMGWEFEWDSMNDLMDRGADDSKVEAIRQTFLETPRINGVHDLKTRKMGDLLVVDAHIEVHSLLAVENGHGIAVEARKRFLKSHRAINLMTHVDPGYRRETVSS